MPKKADLIVIGASAGGWKALPELFRGLGSDLDATVLVALHMKQKGPALLAEVLAAAGSLPAAAAKNGESFKKGRIYVAPPGFQLEIERRKLKLSEPRETDPFCPWIDLLFKSAAKACGSRVIGVILTGMLDDGAEGLAEIKRRGGITLVQRPDEAFASNMPDAALARTKADYVLSIAEIPEVISKLSRSS